MFCESLVKFQFNFLSTDLLGGSFEAICVLRFKNTTVLHLQSYAILTFYSEINWVVAANGYSQIYDSDFIMKCFGNNFLERCLYTLLECIALNSPQRTLVWELDCRMTLFCLSSVSIKYLTSGLKTEFSNFCSHRSKVLKQNGLENHEQLRNIKEVFQKL